MNNNLNKIIKYISYGSIVLITFIMGMFIISNKDDLKAGAVYVETGRHNYNDDFLCTEGAPKDQHSESEVVTGYDIHAPHCHKGTWVHQGDDAGDGGSEYIDYQEFND